MSTAPSSIKRAIAARQADGSSSITWPREREEVATKRRTFVSDAARTTGCTRRRPSEESTSRNTSACARTSRSGHGVAPSRSPWPSSVDRGWVKATVPLMVTTDDAHGVVVHGIGLAVVFVRGVFVVARLEDVLVVDGLTLRAPEVGVLHHLVERRLLRSSALADDTAWAGHVARAASPRPKPRRCNLATLRSARPGPDTLDCPWPPRGLGRVSHANDDAAGAGFFSFG